jgi:MFS transporter, DHA1 family, tetracycline resistance protein
MRRHDDTPARFTGEYFTGEYFTGEYATTTPAVRSSPPVAAPRWSAAGATWPLLLVAMLDTAGLMVAVLRIPPLVRATGGGAVAMGALTAAFALAQMASAMGWGRLSDRMGRRAALVAGLGLSTAGWLLLLWARAMPALATPTLAVARMLMGIGSGTAGVVVAAILDGAPPRGRAALLGRLSAATSLGAVVGPAVALALAECPMTPEHAMTVLTALGLAVVWRTLPRGARVAARGRGDARAVPRWGRSLLPLLVAIYAVAVGAASGVPTMLPAIFDESRAAWAVMALGATGVLVRAALVGPLAARLGERRMLGAGLSCIVAALLLLCRPSGAALPVVVAALALGTALAFPALGALVARATPPSRLGAVMGAQQAAGGAARAAFPLALGVALDGGRPSGLLTVWAVVLAVAAGGAFAGRSYVVRPAVRRPGARAA